MCMTPHEPTIERGDAPQMLTADALRTIRRFLEDTNDAPGREERLEVYAMMLLNAVEEGNAKLRAQARRISMHEKVQNSWRKLISEVRRRTKNE